MRKQVQDIYQTVSMQKNHIFLENLPDWVCVKCAWENIGGPVFL